MSLDLSAWIRPQLGALFVVTGASGTGKTTLVRAALAAIPSLAFSVSATTRPMRTGERDGVDYHFVTHQRFAELVAQGDMLEFAEVYGNRYGTPARPVREALAAGESILLDIDPQGAEQVRAAMPEAVSVFILPPSIQALEQRLRDRSTDSEAVIAGRMADARAHLSRCGEFDLLVVNDSLPAAHDQFQAVIVAELLRRHRHAQLVEAFGG